MPREVVLEEWLTEETSKLRIVFDTEIEFAEVEIAHQKDALGNWVWLTPYHAPKRLRYRAISALAMHVALAQPVKS